MKSYADLEQLLDRYWEGETSLEEEQWLKKQFESGQYPSALNREARYFLGLLAEQSVELPAAPTTRPLARRLPIFQLTAAAAVALLLTAGLWWCRQPADPAPVQPIAAQQPSVSPDPAPNVDPAPSPNIAVAQLPAPRHRRPAGSAVPPAPPIAADTYDDPEQALEEIRAALALVSSKINRSRRTLDRGLQEIDRLEIVFKKKKESSG